MKKQPVKLDGKVWSLKKYVRQSKHYATFKIANQQVTIETGNRPMAIDNGNKVVAIGYVDELGDMAPRIFANQSRDIIIQPSSKARSIFGIFFMIPTIVLYSLMLLVLIDSNSISRGITDSISPFFYGSIFLFLTYGCYRDRAEIKKMQAMFKR